MHFFQETRLKLLLHKVSIPVELNDLDKKAELIFDRADDLMINQKKFKEAVSYIYSYLEPIISRNFEPWSGEHWWP